MKVNTGKGCSNYDPAEERREIASAHAAGRMWTPGDPSSYPPATREEALQRLRQVAEGYNGYQRLAPELENAIIDALWDLGSQCPVCGLTIVPR